MRSTQPPEMPHDEHDHEPAESVAQVGEPVPERPPEVPVRWKCSCGFPLRNAHEAFMHRDRSSHYDGKHHVYPEPDRRKSERRKSERREGGL